MKVLASRVLTRLEALEQRQLLRELRPPSGIDFSSNDYLGLAGHPLLKRSMMEAIEREGCGSTGSRLLRGEREIFAAVERRFAAFKAAERALFFSSGYLANLSVLTVFPEPGDLILSDERNHASLIDAVRLSGVTCVVFPHNDVTALGSLLDESRRARRQTFVVTESLFSMDGDSPPLGDYASLCRAAGAALIVDEAHAVGIYGERGSGILEASGVSHEQCISVSTAGKALGVGGAFVAGPAWAIAYLVQRARPFIFSTAPPPAMAAALDASLTIVADEPERRTRLMHLVRVFRERLAEAGIAVSLGCSQIIPVIVGDNDRAVAIADTLQAQGFDIRAIRPPSVPPGTARFRISVNVNLTEPVIEDLVIALAAALR